VFTSIIRNGAFLVAPILALTIAAGCGGDDPAQDVTDGQDVIQDSGSIDDVIQTDPGRDPGSPELPGDSIGDLGTDLTDDVPAELPTDNGGDIPVDAGNDVPADEGVDTVDADATERPVEPCIMTKRLDLNCDGTPDTCQVTEHDANGHRKVVMIDAGCDGKPPFSDCANTTYSEDGLLMSRSESSQCGETPDSACATFHYDEFGRKATETLDEECIGTPGECYTYTYDPSGNLRAVEMDLGCADEMLACLEKTFDAKGNVLTSKSDVGCDDNPSNDSNCTEFGYYANGKPKDVSLDYACVDSPTLCHRYDYFTISGRGTVVVEEQNNCEGGQRICKNSVFKGGYQYLTESEVDQGCDGTPSADCRKYSRDGNGNVTREEVDSNCDGTPEYCIFSRYSGEGVLIFQSKSMTCNQQPIDCVTFSYDGDCRRTIRTEMEADFDISCGQAVGGNTANSGHAVMSKYNCIGWTPTAKEQIFRYVTPAEGCEYKWKVTAAMTSLSADLDLLLLSELNPDTCTAKSAAAGMADESLSWQAIPGDDFFLVVEGYGPTTGTYTLSVTCECLAEPLPSCVDNCGGRGQDGTCGCDPTCQWIGDCCTDWCQACAEDCEASRCGEVDGTGYCDGNTAKRCVNGVLVTEPCGDKTCDIVGYGETWSPNPCSFLPAGIPCDANVEATYLFEKAECVE